MRILFRFLVGVWRRRDIIWMMARRDLATRYIGTLGGFVWLIVQPTATVLVFWFVFSVGFKATGPAFGTGRSSIRRSLGPCHTAARIVFMFHNI